MTIDRPFETRDACAPGFVDRLIHAHYSVGKDTGMVTFERAAKSLSRVVLLDDVE